MAAEDAATVSDVKFGRRFFGGDEPFQLAAYAYGLFAQSTRASLYPGLPGPAHVEGMHREVVSFALAMMRAPPEGTGVMTSGGTESVILALRAAVARARSRGLAPQDMEIIASRSAHPCIDKAAELCNVRLRRIPVDPGHVADVERIRGLISRRTILLYASFPSYAYGLVDDVARLAEIAATADSWLHVDACMSGLLAPFCRLNGEPVPPFDFSIPGVASISADLHKHGYSAKGASVLLFRSGELGRWAPFEYADHPLPPMRTPTLAGTAPGAPVASAWAVIQLLGINGYRALAAALTRTRSAMVEAIRAVEGFNVLGDPPFSIVVITSDVHDVESVREHLTRKGWFTLRVLEPNGIHLNVGACDEALAPILEADLRAAV